MQTNPAVEQNKTLNGPLVREISPVGKEKVYGGNDLVKSQVLSSEWKTERVRKDANGDREDGKENDDDMPCVIGDSEGDCVWRGSRRSVGSSFHRQGAAYWKERLVILRVDRVGVMISFSYSTVCTSPAHCLKSRHADAVKVAQWQLFVSKLFVVLSEGQKDK